ncbi:MAG: ABC transporter ATP-binding protein [Ignavibacteriaceae bacterium]|nr:ABC transporter ATP-binding protein [Ignavibacteriaceae bacterium]
MLDVDIDTITLLSRSSKRILLENLKFELGSNSIYSILGKNGSGKTTLIKSLTGLLPQNQYEVIGKVELNEANLLDTTYEVLKSVRKEKIRYVFQDATNSFDPLRKFEYYFNNSEADRFEIEEQLQYFLLPEYNKISKLYPYELSGGMAQRMSLIFSLIAKPNLIILDEPTSGVDYAIVNLLLLKLKEFVNDAGNSIIIVTQDINFAEKVSDYIAFISDGTISQFFLANEFINSVEAKHNQFINSYRELS